MEVKLAFRKVDPINLRKSAAEVRYITNFKALIKFMNESLRLAKKAFTVATVVATVAWSMGVAAFVAPLTAQAASLADGDLIRSDAKGAYAVYYYFNGKRYVFPTQKTFLSWYSSAQLKKTSEGGLVKIIPAADMGQISMGGNVTYKPGVRMVKVDSDPKVYAVAKNGTLRWVSTAEAASALYGANWNKMIDDIPDGFFTNYTLGADIAAASSFNTEAEKAAATSIAVDKNLGSSTTVPPTTPTASGSLTVSLSPADLGVGKSNPTVLTDSGNNAGGQRANVLTVRLSAGSSEVRVDSLKLRRTGIQTDSDLDAMYLYNGMSLIGQSTSVSKGVATFTKTGGLLTVPANGYVDVSLYVDINKSTATGTTVGWKLDGVDVTSTAASVSGMANGSNWSVVGVSDLGFLDVKNVAPAAASTVDPQDGYDVWKFRLDANSQDMLVTKLTITNVGSTNDSDIQNFSLWYGSQNLGTSVMTNKKVTFDLSNLPDGGFKIISGNQRQMSLRADIKGGTNRTFKFGFQETTDVVVKDLNYNVWTVPAADDNAAFAVTEAGGNTTINTGTLTNSIATDSPVGNVPSGSTSVLLAKWNMKAAGEAVKVKNLTTTCSSSDSALVLKNIKLSVNGSQVGSTATNLTCSGSDTEAFSFGNSFTVEAGQTAVFTVHADLNDSSVTTGDTVSVSLSAGSSNAQGIVSLTAISTAASSGRTVTVASGTLSVAKNSALGEYSASRPMGVTGATGVRVASFTILGGAEPSEISSIVVGDDTTSSNLSSFFNNIRVMRGTSQLGTTTVTPSSAMTFNISPALVVGVGESVVVDVYGDVLSSPSALSGINGDEIVRIDSVTATGKNTGATTSVSPETKGQKAYVATNGMLRVTADANTPSDTQLVLGSTDQTFLKVLLAEESNAEDILVKKLYLQNTITTNTATPFASTGTVQNVKIYNGSALLGTVPSFGAGVSVNTTTPVAVFDLTGLATGGLVVPKGQSVVLTAKADLTPWSEGGIASSTHKFGLAATDADLVTNGTQNSIEAIGMGSGFSISTTNASTTSGLVIGASSGSSSSALAGNVMDALRTKISFAISDDAGLVSPSAASAGGTATNVAIFKVSNTANVGNYKATLSGLNFDVSSSGVSLTANAALTVYKVANANDNKTDSTNALGTTTYSGNQNFVSTQIPHASFTDLEISAGSAWYLYVTLNTSDSSIGVNDSVTVGLNTGSNGGQSAVRWTDGVEVYTEVNGLPLSGRAVRF